MKSSLFLVTLFLSATLFAQVQPRTNADTAWQKKHDTGSIIVHKDHRLDLLVKKQIQINEVTTRDARRIGKGYRLMIISTSKESEATAAKTKIYTYFPELKAYLWHQSPYYKVKAGNFKERKEAEEYQKKLNVYFPKGVFIMSENNVELKPDKNREEDM